MSLARLVYYGAIIGGWAAFFGWLVTELIYPQFGIERNGFMMAVLTGATVGGAIGGGVSAAGGLGNPQFNLLFARFVPGFLGGVLAGAVGTFVGGAIYTLVPSGAPPWISVPIRALGWMFLGIGVGIVVGIVERSRSKLANGLLGGTLGGLMGGLMFDPLSNYLNSGSGMTGRATGFVVLGLCIGALIGLAQVVLKHAWLTVLDGYRTGRQLILSQPVTILGRAEHLPLPFIGPSNQGLELQHARISRQSNGSFLIEDLKSALGTRLNSRPLSNPVLLNDGDVIKIGPNSIRFNERQRKANERTTGPAAGNAPQARSAPPPPKPPASNRGRDSSSPANAASRPVESSLSTPCAGPLKPAAGPPKPTIPASQPKGVVPSQPGSARRTPPPPPPPPRRPNS